MKTKVLKIVIPKKIVFTSDEIFEFQKKIELTLPEGVYSRLFY